MSAGVQISLMQPFDHSSRRIVYGQICRSRLIQPQSDRGGWIKWVRMILYAQFHALRRHCAFERQHLRIIAQVEIQALNLICRQPPMESHVHDAGILNQISPGAARDHWGRRITGVYAGAVLRLTCRGLAQEEPAIGRILYEQGIRVYVARSRQPTLHVAVGKIDRAADIGIGKGRIIPDDVVSSGDSGA